MSFHLQNLALNVAEKGFSISVYNRSGDKTDAAVSRAQKEGVGSRLHGFHELKDFVQSLERPRCVRDSVVVVIGHARVLAAGCEAGGRPGAAGEVTGTGRGWGGEQAELRAQAVAAAGEGNRI